MEFATRGMEIETKIEIGRPDPCNGLLLIAFDIRARNCLQHHDRRVYCIKYKMEERPRYFVKTPVPGAK